VWRIKPRLRKFGDAQALNLAAYALTKVTVIFGVVATHPVGCFCGHYYSSLQSKTGVFSAAGLEGKQEAQSQTAGSDSHSLNTSKLD
jgi:hypothetical protein